MVDRIGSRDTAESSESSTHTPPSEPETAKSWNSSTTAKEIVTTDGNEDKNESKPRSTSSIWSAFVPWRYGLSLTSLFGKNPEAVEDGRFEGLNFESVDDYPRGYSQFAAFQNSDRSFRVYRRFGTLRNRVILYRQQELSEMEIRLNRLDKEDADEKRTRLTSFRVEKKDKSSERMTLINDIDNKLKEYDDLLERESRLGLLQQTPRRSFHTLVHYLWNTKPIVKSEMQFLTPRDDFVMLSSEQESPLYHALDKAICKIPWKRFRQWFASEEQHNKMKSQYFVHLSVAKLANFVRVVAIILAILLISIPVYFLSSNSYSPHQKLLVVVIAIILFPIAVELTASPRNHELFAITAAYCAVLTACLAATNIYISQAQTTLSQGRTE